MSEQAILERSTWAYNKDDSPYAAKGTEYEIVRSHLLVKVEQGGWHDAVAYAKAPYQFGAEIFVRDVKTFRESFVWVKA